VLFFFTFRKAAQSFHAGSVEKLSAFPFLYLDYIGCHIILGKTLITLKLITAFLWALLLLLLNVQ